MPGERIIEKIENKPRDFKVPDNRRRDLVKDLKSAPITMRQLIALCVWLCHVKETATAALAGRGPCAGSLLDPCAAAIFITKVSKSMMGCPDGFYISQCISFCVPVMIKYHSCVSPSSFTSTMLRAR